jgi:hypothetical protein
MAIMICIISWNCYHYKECMNVRNVRIPWQQRISPSPTSILKIAIWHVTLCFKIKNICWNYISNHSLKAKALLKPLNTHRK